MKIHLFDKYQKFRIIETGAENFTIEEQYTPFGFAIWLTRVKYIETFEAAVAKIKILTATEDTAEIIQHRE